MITEYTPRAIRDIAMIANFIKADSPQSAIRVEQVIRTSIKRLLELPSLGAIYISPKIHTLLARPFPYRIFYRIENNSVVILHIRNERRLPIPPNDL